MINATHSAAEMSPLIDIEHLQMLSELSSDGEDLVGELTEIFSSDAPAILAQLSSAVQRHDNEQIRRLAHRLKGSAANLGARRLAEHCGRLEKIAAAGLTAIDPSECAVIESELAEFNTALSRWLSQN